MQPDEKSIALASLLLSVWRRYLLSTVPAVVVFYAKTAVRFPLQPVGLLHYLTTRLRVS